MYYTTTIVLDTSHKLLHKLLQGSVYVYLTDIGQHKQYILSYRSILSQDEHIIAEKFYTLELRERYIATHSIYFNMSHSEDKLGYIFLAHAEVKIDIEVVLNNLRIQEIAYSVFSQEEIKVFSCLSLAEQEQYFYKLWTMKEALLKAEGRGLNHNLQQINIPTTTNSLVVKLDNKA